LTELVLTSELVGLEVSDAGVAVVTVDNPPVNALTNETLTGLGEAAGRIAASSDVRSIVITGAGDRAFMAGADIEEFRGALGSRTWIEEHTSLTRRVFDLWDELAQPLVAAVQASAVGGGLEVVLLCDIVVADPRASFGFPEVTLGLIPGAGGTQRLSRRVSASAASELLLLGELVDATRARELGLVTRVAESGEATAHAKQIAERLAALPSRAVQSVKKALRGSSPDLSSGLDLERDLFLDVFGSEDAREGLAAFIERRPPQFRHR
jgi:enoyl-CoA hydratase/carnithine racemase